MIKNKQENLLQIGIFPRRLLEPPTAEKLLNEIYNVDGITRMLLQGSDLPVRILHGQGKDVDITHPDRQTIIVGNIAFELTVRVGGIYIEVESSAEENLSAILMYLQHMAFEIERKDRCLSNSRISTSIQAS